MSSKHTTKEWQRTRKHVRAGVARAYAEGGAPTCWRCGVVIPEGMAYDVGHIDPWGGEGLDNAAPEHRTKTGGCPGNRNLGGRMGARITNAKKPGSTSTFRPLPWAFGLFKAHPGAIPGSASSRISPSVGIAT